MTETLQEAPPAVRWRKFRSRDAWLKARLRSIGASEAAAVCGVSPWQSPYSLWADKLNPSGPISSTPAMEWGLRLEPAIAKAYKDATEAQWYNPGTYAVATHPYYEWMTATPDRILVDGDAPLQVKCANQYTSANWGGEPPLHYKVQVQHEIAVMGAEYGVLAVLIGGSDFRHYRIERNDKFIEALTRELAAFWQRIQDAAPPPIDGHDSTTATIKRLYGRGDETEIALPSEAIALDERRQNLMDTKTAIEQELTAINNNLKGWIGNATYGVLPNARYKLTTSDVAESVTAAHTRRQLYRSERNDV